MQGLSSLTLCGPVEPKLEHSYMILIEVTPLLLIEHRSPAYRILAETPLIKSFAFIHHHSFFSPELQLSESAGSVLTCGASGTAIF